MSKRNPKHSRHSVVVSIAKSGGHMRDLASDWQGQCESPYPVKQTEKFEDIKEEEKNKEDDVVTKIMKDHFWRR